MSQLTRNFSRRYFLKGTAAVSAGLMCSTKLRAIGANDAVRIAVVGFHARGQAHIAAFGKQSDVRITALCDADQHVLEQGVADQEKKGNKVVGYEDVRKLLEDKNVDAIATATPNHWHSLITVWACQAGKDVYVDKPISHNIWEGRKCVEAAAKYNRVVQHGTQRRSDEGYRKLVESLQGGKLGKILYARGLCYKPRPSIGKVSGPQPIPAGVNYDLWCGPAPMEPLMRKNLHYDWHWVWPTGCGDIGNQGVHEMDQCRWALGQQTQPQHCFSFGGRFGYDDDATTPNTLVAVYDYQPAPLIFEVRGLPRKKGEGVMDVFKPGDVRIGVVIYCEGGFYAAGENGGWIYDNDGKRIEQVTTKGQPEHQANFIKAVRSRKPEDQKAPAIEAHYSASLCHLGNIPYRVGKGMKQGEIADAVKSNKIAAEALERTKAHLAANGVDLDKDLMTLGPTLTFDPKTEKFTGPMSDEANKLVKRDPYRAPYVVPDQV